MVKRFKVSLYAAALAGFSLLAMGCDVSSPFFNTDGDSWTRILAAILREDLFS